MKTPVQPGGPASFILNLIFLSVCISGLLFPVSALGVNSTSLTHQFLIERWTDQDSLPRSSVSSLAQTRDGTLWVGTKHGLARFDGIRFDNFSQNDLPALHSNADFMAAGPDSQVYVGTPDGLIILSRGRARTIVPQSCITMVLPIGVDEAWLGSDLGQLYHYRRNSVQEVGLEAHTHEPVFGLVMSPDGTLWIATGGGLFLFNNGKITRYQPAIPLPVLPFYDLAASPTGSLFAASDKGLFEIRGSQWKQWTTGSGLPDNALNALVFDSKGVLWIGSERGLSRLVDGAVQRVSSVGCFVNALLVDKENSVWVGCAETGGLIRVTVPPISLVSFPLLPDPVALASMAQDQQGTVWIASSRGLLQYGNHSLKLYTRADGLPSDRVNFVSLAPSGALWIATENGLAKFQNGRFESIRTKREGLANNFLWVLEDRQGTVWAAEDHELRSRRSDESTFHDVQLNSQVWSVREDRDGGIWVASATNGLFRFAGDAKSHFTTACGLGSNTVYDTVQDETGAVWATTGAGLSRIEDGKCANIGANNGIPTGGPGSIISDHHGFLWLRIETGILAINLQEADHVLKKGGSLQNIRFFGHDDGISNRVSDSTFLTPLMLHSSGKVWSASMDGLNILDPLIAQRARPQLRPQTTSLVTDVGEHDLDRPVESHPGDLHLRFAYNAPYLLGAKDREYRFRLTGFDKEWRDGGKRGEAVYTSLPAGAYHFEVSTRLPYESWSQASTPVQLTVLPSFYQTWWWYLLLAFFATASIVSTYKLRMIAVRRQTTLLMTERLDERSRLARELHDTLSQGMVAIHLQIQLARALLRSRPEAAGSHLETAVTIAHRSTSETRRCIAALRSETDESLTLPELLKNAVLRFQASSIIPLAATIQDDLPPMSEEVSYEVARVTEEALANIRLHSDARQAYLIARASGRWLRIEVLDDGKGFNTALREHASSGRFGLTGMEERAQRIHANLEATSVPGKGTTIVLEVPILPSRKRSKGIRSMPFPG